MALLKEQSFSTQELPVNLPNQVLSVCCGKKKDSSLTSGDSSSLSVASGTYSVSANSHLVAFNSAEVSSRCTVGTGHKRKSIYAVQAYPSSIDLSSSVPSATSSASSNPPLVSGQAFFISDSMPVSYFEYFRPLFEGLGYSFPAFTLPLWVILAVAYLQAFTYCLVHKFFPFTPFVTPAEALKSGVTHYCSSQKAMDTFSYSPTRPNDLKQILEYYRGQGFNRTDKMGMISLVPLAFFFMLPMYVLIIVL